MRVLLTGACGRLGNAIRRVGGARCEFVSFDWNEGVEAIGGRRDSGWFRGSILDMDTLARAAEGCDAIIHTAAKHSEVEGITSHRDFIEMNVTGTDNVCRVAATHKIRRVVLASSMAVVFGNRANAHGAALLDESSVPRPDAIYPLTKLMAEQIGSFHAQEKGLEVVQLRYMRILDQPASRIGPELLSLSLTADDCARTALAAATTEGLRNEIIHIGPDTPLTQQDINQALGIRRGGQAPGVAGTANLHAPDPHGVIERHWPGSTEVLKSHNVQLHPHHFWPVTRIDMARRLLNWTPTVTFETFLRELGWQPAGNHA